MHVAEKVGRTIIIADHLVYAITTSDTFIKGDILFSFSVILDYC